jgi:hypothetical protein
MHLGDVSSGVEVITLSEAPSQLLGERLSDSGLAYTRNAHEDDDHFFELPNYSSLAGDGGLQSAAG